MNEWSAYERVYGSLLVHERIDAGFALLGMLIAQTNSDGRRRYKQRDFMPEWYVELTKDDELARMMQTMRQVSPNADDRDPDGRDRE